MGSTVPRGRARRARVGIVAVVVTTRGRAGELGVDASQLQVATDEIGAQRPRLGLGQHRVEADERLAREHECAFGNEDLPHHACLGWLHDPELRAGTEPAVRRDDNVEPAQQRPRERRGNQREHRMQHAPPPGRNRDVLDAQPLRRECARVVVPAVRCDECEHRPCPVTTRPMATEARPGAPRCSAHRPCRGVRRHERR
jgi:hypothetical protein